LARVKKWSSGTIGNEYPDHSERGNPNTSGLTIEGIPGIEGYIEEDRVIAYEDNRPLINLSQNDQVLESNLASVASEVDYGVLRGANEEFKVEVFNQKGFYSDPDGGDDLIEITPLRITAGQSIIDGQVVGVGNQKIIYFLKDDGSYLFPKYEDYEGNTVISVTDDLYRGVYKPVYDIVSDGLPTNFEDYEIKITNEYDTDPTRIQYFKVYRNWEDIIPFPPQSSNVEGEINFIYDENFGQNSEGLWLEGILPEGGSIDNVKVSDVVVKKNITVKDKFLPLDKFIENGGTYEQYIITDGIFFDNVPWKTEIQENKEVQDLYVTDNGDIYFIYKSDGTGNDYLYYLPKGSIQVSNKYLSNTSNQYITKIIEINNFIYILGTNGYFATFDLIIQPDDIKKYDYFSTISENFTDIIQWKYKIWISTDKNLYILDGDNSGAEDAFNLCEIINVGTELDTISNTTNLLNKINKLNIVEGNFFVDSSLKNDIKNYIKNPSFEKGGLGLTPTYWDVVGTGTFVVSSSLDAKYGEYKAVLENTDTLLETFQTFDINCETDQKFIFSVYLKSVNDIDVILKTEGFDLDGILINSIYTTVTITGGEDWTRFNNIPYIAAEGIKTVKVSIILESVGTIQVDAAQFEFGDISNQFVNGFEYLMIGFEKNLSDVSNPPFAFIDSKRIDAINYPTGIYGEIKTINDITAMGNNEIYFIDNNSIYSLIVLNDEDEYSRISIKNISDEYEDLNLKTKIEKLNTITTFDNRIFFGGNILNKSISFHTEDFTENHEITILDPTDSRVLGTGELEINGVYYNITNILGEPTYIKQHEEVASMIEFPRIEEIYEIDENAINTTGVYVPGANYLLAIQIDNNEPIIIIIEMPPQNEGPISVQEIYNKIIDAYTDSVIVFNIAYSNKKVEGLYSIGKNSLTRYIRGNINKIFKQLNIDKQSHYDKGFYIIREDSILRSKYDTNVKKIGDDYATLPTIVGEVENITLLPISANINDVIHVLDFGYYKWDGNSWIDTQYIYKWTLYDTDYELREFKNKYNQLITFSDDALNKNWVDLSITSGYKLTPGSLRVKTNVDTEIGFSENEDYFVDYENGKIIRSTLVNYLKDSNFEFVDILTDWQKYINTSSSGEINLEKRIESFTSFENEENVLGSYASLFITSSSTDNGAIYQIVTPTSLNVGDTYTFSVSLKTNKFKESKIRISECTNSNTDDFTNTLPGSELEYRIFDEDADPYNTWKRYVISHTITDVTSTKLRVEIHTDTDSIEQLFIKEAQLERNQIVTPYVRTNINSRLDAGAPVWVDYTETRTLTVGSDYSFDIENRKVILYNEPLEDTQLYFDYKYEKIFNPKIYGTSIPKFEITYDDRDDYFLYLYEGRIWAINLVLALLSQDEDNPLIINYNYHYPRIDKIKIRNIPDIYGNYIYIVKGKQDSINPYGPYDKGTQRLTHVQEVDRNEIENTKSNEMLYEINVLDNDYNNNDIYDRRIFIESRDHRYFNISLYDQTVGYMPFTKDFMSTSGMNPINKLNNSKIVDIIKNFDIKQLEEIGAWGSNYQLVLRNKLQYPATALSIFVDTDVYSDGTNKGSDTNSGVDKFNPLKTIKEAVRRIKEESAPPNIIVVSQSLIIEDIEINHIETINIFAETYARWKGNIQNITPLKMQGFIFENHNFYVVHELDLYYNTFKNCTVNNYIPTHIHFYNCEIDSGNNTFLYIKNILFPSPFLHPYQRNLNANDNVEGDPISVATEDLESIYPNVDSYNKLLVGNPSGDYRFERCLVNGLRDDFVRYDLTDEEPWISSFTFERSTIVKNANIFYTNKSSQNIIYNECILWENKEIRGTESKIFDSRSNITLQNCFIDFNSDESSDTINYNFNGDVYGRETCIDGSFNIEPGFISTQARFENYRLRSEAMGYLTDSINIGKATDGRDLGCYDELRERLDVEVPKKLKSYFAFIDEGIHYPIILNSEKITFTLEFKPSNSFNTPSVLFDTRSSADDKDYIMVVYNNNSGDKITDIEPDPTAEITDPYTFKIILVNEETKYVVVSPINMYSDADYQVWNTISFTANYEKTFNEKSTFDEKDKYQNIITFFHNEELAVESFLKNDLSYDDHNTILEGYNNDNTNAWNYNNISKFITISSSFDNKYILTGYYSELRIDNKFINRKELEAWNNKVVPFNDPITYIDQNNLARTFDSSIINELWTLKTKFDVGAKGHHFNELTNKRFTYDEGELIWVLTGPTENYLNNADLNESIFASVVTDIPPNNDTEDLFPIVFDHEMIIKTSGNTNFDSTTGIVVDFLDGGTQFYSHEELYVFLQNVLNDPVNVASKIQIELLTDKRFRISTNDYSAESISIEFKNDGDAEEFGFITPFTGNPPDPDDDYIVTQGIGYDGVGVSTIITGFKNINSIVITTGIVDTLSMEHNAWLEYGEQYTNLSPTSLGISRIITSNNDDTIEANDNNEDKYITILTHRKSSYEILSLYDETSIEPIEYTYSIYMYRRSNEFSQDDVKVVIIGDTLIEGIIEPDYQVEYEFDTIENIYGYWWKATKRIRILSDQSPDIGIIVKGELSFYIDAFQLEKGTFASPFVVDNNSNHGMLELDKALLKPDRGVIFFRFKPLFDYYTTEKKVLLEMLSSEEVNGVDVIDKTKGFRIWYKYNEEIQKGTIQFRTVKIEDDGDLPDDAAWEVVVLEQFFTNWHTIILSYDFNTKRFLYFFDYFKNAVDTGVNQYEFFTNLNIGSDIRGYETNGATIPEFSASADIMVKDVLITNYTTSDQELKNWINAHEFYKETLFNNLLDSYQHDMLDVIKSIENISVNTYDIEQNINLLNSRITSLDSIVDSATDIQLLKVRQDELRDEVFGSTSSILTNITDLDTARAAHNIRISTNSDSIAANNILIIENTNLIAQEVSDRINLINDLIVKLASTNLGDGASTIGVHDPNNKFTSTDVEAVLLEIEDRVSTNENGIANINNGVLGLQTEINQMQEGDGSTYEWTAAKAINNGWNIGSIRTDINQELIDRANADTLIRNDLTLYTDNAIDDLAGTGRIAQTIKSNWDLIQTNIIAISDLTTASGTLLAEQNKIKDGLDGTTWVDTMNLFAHNNRLDATESATGTNTTNIGINATDISTNADDIDLLEGRATTLETNLGQEVIDRGNADTLIRSDLASSANALGASLIGIEDVAGSYVAINVEDALAEIDSKLQALVGSLSWKASVADVVSLPTVDNNLGDARTVMDDGDGKAAQYIWDGSSWIKVADIDWGSSSDISHDPVNSGLLATTVKGAIDELYARSAAPNNSEVEVTTVDWIPDSGNYYVDILHELGTTNISIRAVDASGMEVGVEEYERLNNDTVRVWVPAPTDTTFTIFGANNSYSKLIGSWTLSGGMYLKDIVHNFGTQQIMISAFNIMTGELIGMNSVEIIDDNAIRIMTDNNSDVINVFILNKTSDAKTKDLEYWVPNNGMYECILPLAVDYDAVYSFFDPITNKTVGVDTVKFESGMLKIVKTNNTPLRMVVLR